MRKTESVKNTGELVARNFFQSRYFNIAALTDNGSTISTQIWVDSEQAIAEAEKTLLKWATPAEEKWSNGKVIYGVIKDTKGGLRRFTRITDLPDAAQYLMEVR